MAVPVNMWREMCSCAGAEHERRRQREAGTEFPDSNEHIARFQRDSQARHDAFQAVRANAAGKSRAEIRDLYVFELQSRGLPIPPEDVLDTRVDAILGDYLPTARLLGRSLANLARFIGTITRASL
jgi:hypothetical protein